MIFIALKIFPKPAKILQSEFFLKASLYYSKNYLVVYASQYPASRGYIFAV